MGDGGNNRPEGLEITDRGSRDIKNVLYIYPSREIFFEKKIKIAVTRVTM